MSTNSLLMMAARIEERAPWLKERGREGRREREKERKKERFLQCCVTLWHTEKSTPTPGDVHTAACNTHKHTHTDTHTPTHTHTHSHTYTHTHTHTHTCTHTQTHFK